MLLPHNTDRLAQLGVDKRLIKNKKVLSDILQKKKPIEINKNRIMREVMETQPKAVKRKQLLSRIANSKNPETIVILKSKAMSKLSTAMTKLNIALLKFLQKKQLRVVIAKVQMCLPLWS